MRKIIAIAIAMIALSAPAAHAQFKEGTQDKKTPLQKLEEDRQRGLKETDKEFQAAMKRKANISAPAAVADPWANVRPTTPDKKK
jgi:hypothetical protein